jgi:hypothetical protein
MAKINNEQTGSIVGLNIHDYDSDFDKKRWDGCLASIKNSKGEVISLYTTSHRLQAALVMAYVTRVRVTVYLGDLVNVKGTPEMEKLLSSMPTSDGPFSVNAVWTQY